MFTPKPALFALLLSALAIATPAQTAPITPPAEGVVLVNTFEVKPGREAECLAMWDRTAAFLSQKPGFVSTRLHRALKPDARFGFVNVAHWSSPTAFHAAVSDPQFREISQTDACVGSPGLFSVMRSL